MQQPAQTFDVSGHAADSIAPLASYPRPHQAGHHDDGNPAGRDVDRALPDATDGALEQLALGIPFGISPLDPITFTMPVVLAVAAVPAGHVSARRSQNLVAIPERCQNAHASGGKQMKATRLLVGIVVALGVNGAALSAQNEPPAGFVSIFNGKDLTGWKIPEGDNGHWKVLDGVIDYDAGSEAPKDKNLWTVKPYRNFVARVDWRIKSTPYISKNMRIVMPDGRDKLDENGQPIRITAPDSDSGFILRGSGKAQLNIWCWPVGSGEMYGYRTDPNTSPAIKAAATPKMNADNDIGKWNTFEVTVQGSTVTVVLNGKTVIDKITLPDLPAEGPLGLQHHGGVKDGVYTGIPALVQFRNIYVKELP
jgi:hypothetical protein